MILYLRCSLLLILFTSNVYAEKFSSKECLTSKFETDIKHEGKFFGLIKNNLNIKKNGCLLDVTFKNILETTWVVDICREPIHIKVKKMENESFYKREGGCTSGPKNDFCEHWTELKENLQDYGLIFAKGEREDLSTSHGQTYCSYLLLQRYLDDGVLFSKYEEPKSIFEKEDMTKACPLPIDSNEAPIITSPNLGGPNQEKLETEVKKEEAPLEERPRF